MSTEIIKQTPIYSLEFTVRERGAKRRKRAEAFIRNRRADARRGVTVVVREISPLAQALRRVADASARHPTPDAIELTVHYEPNRLLRVWSPEFDIVTFRTESGSGWIGDAMRVTAHQARSIADALDLLFEKVKHIDSTSEDPTFRQVIVDDGKGPMPDLDTRVHVARIEDGGALDMYVVLDEGEERFMLKRPAGRSWSIPTRHVPWLLRQIVGQKLANEALMLGGEYRLSTKGLLRGQYLVVQPTALAHFEAVVLRIFPDAITSR